MAGPRPLADRHEALHLCLFRHFKRVIDLDAEVSDGAFELRVTEHRLDSPEVLRAAINQ